MPLQCWDFLRSWYALQVLQDAWEFKNWLGLSYSKMLFQDQAKFGLVLFEQWNQSEIFLCIRCGRDTFEILDHRFGRVFAGELNVHRFDEEVRAPGSDNFVECFYHKPKGVVDGLCDELIWKFILG